MLESITAKAGVRTEYRYDESTPTGRCGVIITGHDRSLCTDLAAANLYKIEHLKQPEIWKLVEGAKFFYVGGYHLTVCVPAILALAEEAASNDKVGALLKGELGWKEALTKTDIPSQSLGAVHPAILQGPSR